MTDKHKTDLDKFACIHCGHIYHRHGLRETFCENCDRILKVKKVEADMVNHPPHYKDASGIEVGSFWHEKQEDSTIGIIHVYEVSNEMVLYWMGGERCGCSPDVFLSTFERFESVGPDLKNLIEVASRFGDWGEKPSGKSMSENEDDLLDYSQQIIDAINQYEAASVKGE